MRRVKRKTARPSKKMATAQDRLRRMQELIEPYAKPSIPQVRAPKGDWVPGGEFSHIRRSDDEADQYQLCIVE